MTDDPDHRPPDLPLDGPLDADDLAVAAVLDGDATAEQRRRVARAPELVGRLRAAEAAVAAVRGPLDGPGEDVFAALRARAVAALDEPARPSSTSEGDDDPTPTPAADDPGPVTEPAGGDDLATRRARRARRLPPLPAVAAVVILLVVVGIGLLVSDDRSSEDTASEATASADAGGSAADDASAAAEGGRPADEPLAALLARTTASFTDDDTLFEALRQVDPTTLDLAAAADGAAPSTAAPPPGDGRTATTTTGAATTAGSGADGRVLAEDDDVLRCDSVMRSAEPELEPATAAVFVSVGGTPVVILSNAVPASEDGPATTRLTALNALDCSPRGAVQR